MSGLDIVTTTAAANLTAHHIGALVGVGVQRPRKPNRLRVIEHHTDRDGTLMTRMQIGKRWFIRDSSVPIWVWPDSTGDDRCGAA